MKKRILSLVIAILIAIPAVAFAAEEAEFPAVNNILYEDFSGWSSGVLDRAATGILYPKNEGRTGELEIFSENGKNYLKLKKAPGFSGDGYPLWRYALTTDKFSSAETVTIEYKIKPQMSMAASYFRSRTAGQYGTHMPLFQGGKIYESNLKKTVIGTYDDWITVTTVLYKTSYMENGVEMMKRDIYLDGKHIGTFSEPYLAGTQDFRNAEKSLNFNFNLVGNDKNETGFILFDYIKAYTEGEEFIAKCDEEIADSLTGIKVKFSNHPAADAFVHAGSIYDEEGNLVGGISSADIITSFEKNEDVEYRLNFENMLEPSKKYTLSFDGLCDNIGRSFTGSFDFYTPPAKKYGENFSVNIDGMAAECISDGAYQVDFEFINEEESAVGFNFFAALCDEKGVISELKMIPMNAEKGTNPMKAEFELSGTEGKTLKLFATLAASNAPASAVYELSAEGMNEPAAFNWLLTAYKEDIAIKNIINGDTQEITTLSGDVSGRPAALFVLKEGKTVADINPENPLDTVVQIVSGEFTEAGFTYSIIDVKGNYEAYLYPLACEKSGAMGFEYFGAAYMEEGLEILEEIEDDGVPAFLEGYAKALTLDMTVYDEMEPDEKERIADAVEAYRNELEGKKYIGYDQFVVAFNDAIALNEADSSEEIIAIINEKGSETALKLYDNVISERAKADSITRIIAKKPLTYKQFKAIADEMIVLAGVRNSENYSQTESIIANSLDITGIDLGLYNTLKSKKSVNVAISGKEYSDADELKDAFDDAVADARRNESRPSTGGGGGGGGGGSAAIKSDMGKMEMDAVIPTKEEAELMKSSFSDLEGFGWAEAAIYSLREKGIVNGKTADTFEPAANITRAEFAKLVVKAFELKRTGLDMSFKDVNATDWFFEAVMAAYENGVINGIGEGEFAPSKNITRQDAAVILYRAAEKKGISLKGAKLFADSDEISEYAVNAVSVFGANGIINGFEDGSFAPFEEITRAQAAVVINKLLER